MISCVSGYSQVGDKAVAQARISEHCLFARHFSEFIQLLGASIVEIAFQLVSLVLIGQVALLAI